MADQYVIIGGTACEINLNALAIDFRETKDIDMVLLVESLIPEFGATLWEYIRKAGYSNIQKSTGRAEYYRFFNPLSRYSFPTMIELLARTPGCIHLPKDARITPIPFGHYIGSLSAIIMDDEYYDLLTRGRIIHDSVSVLDIDYLILFKIKAWLNLNQERSRDVHSVQGHEIKKHKNDIIRLSRVLLLDKVLDVPETIYTDIQDFISAMRDQHINPRQFDGATIDDVIDVLTKKYKPN